MTATSLKGRSSQSMRQSLRSLVHLVLETHRHARLHLSTPATMTPTQMTDSRSPEVNGDMTTIWIPLTTAYPCHTSCSSLFWRLDKEDSPIVAWDPGYELWVDPSASCQPAAVSSWWHAEDRDQDIVQTRWSLGPLVCPGAYTTAMTSDAGAGSTLLGCCPRYVLSFQLRLRPVVAAMYLFSLLRRVSS